MALADLLNDEETSPMASTGGQPSASGGPGERNGHGELQLIGSLELPSPSSLNPRSAPRYQQPLLMTSFSYGKRRELLLGERKDESLKEMRPVTDLPKDLNEGFDAAHWRDEGVDEGLDSLLDCLLDTISSAPPEERQGWEGRMAATELVTWRGMMTRIMTAGYETANSDGWEMNAMSLDGTLYLEEAASPKPDSESTPERKRQTYYGYAYESVCTSAPPEERAPYDPPLDPVDTDVQWCAVVKANLGGVGMILGGEVDCVEEGALKDPARTVSPADFVELKTQLELAEAKDRSKFERFKMLKFYVQSFLLGTPVVRVGFRTREGLLTTIHNFPTLGIPAFLASQSHPKPPPWSSSACVSTAAITLRFLLETLSPAQEAVARYNEAFREQARDSRPGEGLDVQAWKAWPVFRIRFVPPKRGGDKKSGSVQVLGYVDPEADAKLARPTRPRIGFLPAEWVEARWVALQQRQQP